MLVYNDMSLHGTSDWQPETRLIEDPPPARWIESGISDRCLIESRTARIDIVSRVASLVQDLIPYQMPIAQGYGCKDVAHCAILLARIGLTKYRVFSLEPVLEMVAIWLLEHFRLKEDLDTISSAAAFLLSASNTCTANRLRLQCLLRVSSCGPVSSYPAANSLPASLWQPGMKTLCPLVPPLDMIS